MSTWKIFSDAGSNFRWETTKDAASNAAPFLTPVPSTSPFPSMSDLLIQPSTLQLFTDHAAPQGEEQVIGDNSCGFGNSLFKTAYGKRVTISSNGLVRAKTLLGLKEDVVRSHQHAIGEAYDRQQQHLPHLQQLHQVKDSCKIMSAVPCQSPSVSGRVSTIENDFEKKVVEPDTCGVGAAVKPAPIKFHTAGERSISISNDALRRARSLLGDPDLGDFVGSRS